MAMIALFCSIFIYLSKVNSERNLQNHISSQASTVRALAQTIEEQHSRQYQQRIKSLINYRKSPNRRMMLEAFANQDKQRLLQLATPYFELLREESPYFSTFGWVLPNNHAFVRIHNPDKFGEDVSKMRPDVVAANKEKVPFAGFTAGYAGMQYRIVQPVNFEGRHLGVIQFGISDELLLDTITSKLKMPVGLIIPNDKFTFVKRSKVPYLSSGENTIQTRHTALFDGLKNLTFDRPQQRFTLQNKEYMLLRVLELRNFNQEPQGEVFIALDISREIREQRDTFFYTVLLTIFLLLGAFLVLYTSYGVIKDKDLSSP